MAANLEDLSFAALLDELERRLRAAGTSVPDRLAPGLPDEEVRSRLAEVGLDAPGDLVTWFGWHNGIRPEAPPVGANQLIVEMPLSLDQALDDWAERDHGPESWQWERGWLPLAYHDNADRLAIDCTPPQGQVARAYMWSPHQPFADRTTSDIRPLATVVRWWLEAWDAGAYEYTIEPFPSFGPALIGEARLAVVPPERFGFI